MLAYRGGMYHKHLHNCSEHSNGQPVSVNVIKSLLLLNARDPGGCDTDIIAVQIQWIHKQQLIDRKVNIERETDTTAFV